MMVVLGLSAQAGAQTHIDEDVIRLEFGAPGQVTVDARPGNSMIPLHDQLLSFPNWEDYLEFLSRVFNVGIIKNGNVKVPYLTMEIWGEPKTLTPGLDALQNVEDPIGTFVGGQKGEVEVDGMVYCVNPDLCANAVSPLTLGPVQSTMIGDGWTGQSPTWQSPTWQSANVQSAPGGFAIASTLTLNTIATIYGPETVLREHVSEVYQVSGSFGYTVFFHSEPELVCVELEGSLADQKFDSSTCFLSGGKVIGAIEGSNELGTELQIFGAQVEDGKCVYGMIQVGPRTLRDVMRVSVRHTAIMSNGWYWPDQRSFQPDYLLGFSTGQDRVQRVSAWDWKRLDTGLTPACK